MSDKGINFEEDAAENHIPSDGELRLVSKLCELRVDLGNHLRTYENEVKRLKDEINVLDKRDIPDAMKQAGMQKFTLDTGESVEIVEDVAVSIAKKNQQQAFEWLREHGGGPIVKSKYEFVFGKGEEDKAKLLEKAIPLPLQGYTKKTEGVHAQSLKAFVKRELEENGDIDEEGRKLLGVYEYKVVKINV